MELTSAVCSVTATQRRRYFWAAWWTGDPCESPFRAPDASNGGSRSFEEALAEAEQRAGRALTLIEPYWARAWTRVMRGERPPSRPVPRAKPERPVARSAWEMLGLTTGASLAEIKTAFRERALSTHPDHGGDADEFRALYRAYERLVAKRR
jgi:hypothetical protein